ncbi:MAG: hypothetical protein WCR06_05155 [bacterium]
MNNKLLTRIAFCFATLLCLALVLIGFRSMATESRISFGKEIAGVVAGVAMNKKFKVGSDLACDVYVRNKRSAPVEVRKAQTVAVNIKVPWGANYLANDVLENEPNLATNTVLLAPGETRKITSLIVKNGSGAFRGKDGHTSCCPPGDVGPCEPVYESPISVLGTGKYQLRAELTVFVVGSGAMTLSSDSALFRMVE